MMNTVVWGFCGKQGQAIVDAFASSLQITDWFSDEVGAHSIHRFLLGQVPLCTRHGDAVLAFRRFQLDHFRTYSNLVQRRGLQFANLHQLGDEFALNFYYFYDLLVRQKTALVVFANLPHEGSDFVLYQLARLFGLRTLLCYQSIFPGRFCIATSMEDFGRFENTPAIFDHQSVELEQGFQQSLFYMRAVEARQAAELSHWSAKAVITAREGTHRVARMGKRALGFLARPRRVDLSNRAREFIGLHLERKYRANLRRRVIERSRVREMLGRCERLVYFPLHLQPELTTSAVGGVFQDQLYALEVLRGLLGREWTILVKENPKQGHFQRDDSFFARLSNIEDVHLVDGLFPSAEIMAKAALTVTVTGTAGWEAIKGGGKCLVFGQAWYASLAGCLTYSDSGADEALRAFLDQPHSFEEFRESCESLWRKMGVGVVDPDYSGIVREFKADQNACDVVQSLFSVLGSDETKW